MPLRFGGDLDDPQNPADPFGFRASVERHLIADTQQALQREGVCAELYYLDNGDWRLCMTDYDLCTQHNPATAARATKFYDRYVGALARMFRR